MVEQISEEEGVENRIQLFFTTSSKQVKEKLLQSQVNKSYNKKVQQRMKQFQGYRIWKQRKRKYKIVKFLSHCKCSRDIDQQGCLCDS